MLLGLRTVIYPAKDLDAAKAWFTQLTGAAPYFDQPFYVGFNVAGFELGLLPADDPGGDAEATTYWGTADIDAEVRRVAALGATLVSAIQDVGEGIKVAVVASPMGDRIGLIENPHFKLP